MRRRDKLKNIVRANLLAEQRHLESKGVLTEGIIDTVKDKLTGPINDLIDKLGDKGQEVYNKLVDRFGENPSIDTIKAKIQSELNEVRDFDNLGMADDPKYADKEGKQNTTDKIMGILSQIMGLNVYAWGFPLGIAITVILGLPAIPGLGFGTIISFIISLIINGLTNRYGRARAKQLDEDAVDTLQQIMQEPIGSFAPKFKSIASDPKVQAVLKAGLKDGNVADEKTNLRKIVAVATQLRPTQNVIGTDESLDNILDDKYGSLRSFLEGKAAFPTPIITLNGKYIIDGHHRWSQAYAANPKVQIQCNDIQLDLDPTDVLKVIHMALAAAKGDIVLSDAQGNNMLDASEGQIKQIVMQKLQPEVGKIYKTFRKGNNKEEVANYIWNNVQMMQSNNTPVDGAPDRSAMPQTDDSGYDKLLSKGVVNFKNPDASDVGGDQQQGNAIEDAEVVAENTRILTIMKHLG